MTLWQNTKRAWSTQGKDVPAAIFVALLSLSLRLPGLSAFLTADEPKSWFGRSIQFLNAVATHNWAATFDSPAPGVTTMWAGAIGLLLEYYRAGAFAPLSDYLLKVPFDPLNPAILPLVRLPGVLIAALAAAFTFWWGRRVWGRTAALLAACLLALNPFLLALSRVLGHDALVALFMWLSLLVFLRAIQTPQPESATSLFTIHYSPFIALSGALGGLAFLTKYPSLSLGAFIAVTLLILRLRSAQPKQTALKRWLADVALWSAAAGLVFVALFPAMWVDPLGRTIAILSDAVKAGGNPHPKGSFFMGQAVADPGASFYLLVTLFKTTPLIWLGWILALAGTISADFRRRWGKTALIMLAFALFYGLLVTVGGKKQDRYILPAFPALLALAAIGYAWAGLTVKQLAQRAKIAARLTPLIARFPAALVALVIVIEFFTVLPHFPYYFTYYNPLLGGGQSARQMMILGWGEGMDAAARWLNAQPNAADLDVVAWYSTTFEPYFSGHAIYKFGETEKISRTPKPGLAADYVVFYVNQRQRELPSLGAWQFFAAAAPVYTVTLHGVDYAWVYPSVGMRRVIEQEARLVGQAELLGFNLLNQAGQSLESLPAGVDSTAQLYWEWQGKKPAEPIGLSLVDQNGNSWGRGTALGTEARLPFAQWQEGMVARDDFTLSVFPGTPPGDYQLKAWIDRPATGELVGTFPLARDDTRVTVTRPPTPISPDTLGLTTLVDRSAAPKITLLGAVGLDQLADPWQTGQTHAVELYWQAQAAITPSYTVTLALVDDAGVTRAEWAGLPAASRFATANWLPGDIIRDPWALTLPANVPAGKYKLRVGLTPAQPIELASVQVVGRPRTFKADPVDLKLAAQFGPAVELTGLWGPVAGERVAISAGEPLVLTLVWRCLSPVAVDYTVTAQVLNAQNEVLAQQDVVPLNGGAPTTSWAAGEIIPDQIRLDIPAALGEGNYRLLVALYNPQTGERLALSTGADHLEIPLKSAK